MSKTEEAGDSRSRRHWFSSIATHEYWILLALLAIWAIGATYAALTNVAFVRIGETALLKAAAILGAFVLFGYLVVTNEKARQRERQLDSEFERERDRASDSDSAES